MSRGDDLMGAGEMADLWSRFSNTVKDGETIEAWRKDDGYGTWRVQIRRFGGHRPARAWAEDDSLAYAVRRLLDEVSR